MSNSASHRSLPPRIELPPRERTLGEGLHFSSHMRVLCDDLTRRLPQLSHIDMERVAISFSQTRKNVAHGLQASLTPLRFEQGGLTTQRRGRLFTLQRLFDADGQEMLYILNFYLPRFLNHSLEEKLITVVHELWHISPDFDGDIRRHPGRCYAHTGSQQEYDAEMARYAGQWLSLKPPTDCYAFLEPSFRELQSQHGRIYGVKIPAPKLIPYEDVA